MKIPEVIDFFHPTLTMSSFPQAGVLAMLWRTQRRVTAARGGR